MSISSIPGNAVHPHFEGGHLHAYVPKPNKENIEYGELPDSTTPDTGTLVDVRIG